MNCHDRKKDHLDFVIEVDQLITQKDFDQLMNYTNFSLCKLMDKELLPLILSSNNKTIIKHVINNIVCYNIKDEDGGLSLIHYLAGAINENYLRNENLLIYFINKYQLDIASLTNDNWQLVHLAAMYDMIKIIKFLDKKGINLESETKNKIRPIHLAYGNGCNRVIKYLIKKNVDLESETCYGMKPIDYYHEYQRKNKWILFIKLNK